jgi:formylglycine-generating enzyme required for sulfatase activity
MRRTIALTWGLAVLLLAASHLPLWAAERYAFLVAVGDYDIKQLRPLKYARNDILEFHKLLLDAGYKSDHIVLMHDEVKTVSDRRYLPEADRIRGELKLLLDGLETDDSLIVAFAGHGVQFKGEDKTYFCPLDAQLDDPKRQRLIAVNELYDSLKRCRATRKLLLVDACREDPQSALSRSNEKVTLESVTVPQLAKPPQGVVTLFSCAEGQKAYEHPELQHGIFFHHVLETWRGAYTDGNEMTLDELIAAAKSQTAKFARLKLAASQTPRQVGFVDGAWVLRKFDAPKLLVAPFDRASATQKQREWSKHLGPTDTVIKNSLGMDLVLIPPGEFAMGGHESSEEVVRAFPESKHKPDDFADEHPQHTVRITAPFYMAACEVTLDQYLTFIKDTKYKVDAEKDGKGGFGWNSGTEDFEQLPQFVPWSWGFEDQTGKHPVVNVTWNDAMAFCHWLSKKENRTYRLPTEAEWEYACRAGSTGRYYFGDATEDLATHANVPDADTAEKFSWEQAIKASDGHAFPSPVGSFRPNAFGLYDMLGNASEWCLDDRRDYDKAPRSDPRGPVSGSRITRGGSWSSIPSYCRSAVRNWVALSFREKYTGFRVVCAADHAKAAKSKQEEWAERLGKSSLVMENSLGMQLTLIPPGEFLMGSHETMEQYSGSFSAHYEKAEFEKMSKDFGFDKQRPAHAIRITKPYYLGTYEVTLDQFLAFVHETKYTIDATKDGKGMQGWTGRTSGKWDEIFAHRPQFVPWSWGFIGQTGKHPVVGVTWADATAFCEWLSKKEGKKYRLPTEAEWEHACRAGTRGRYYFGNHPEDSPSFENVADEGFFEKFKEAYEEGAEPTVRCHDGFVFAAPVGSFRPNPFGLYDMLGNASEWCLDPPREYDGQSRQDPQGPATGKLRLARGGDWSYDAIHCRSASRHPEEKPGERSCNCGFRILCEP